MPRAHGEPTEEQLKLPSGTEGLDPHGPLAEFHFAVIRHTTETSMTDRKAVSARAGIAVQRGWREVAVVTTVIGMMMLAVVWTALGYPDRGLEAVAAAGR